MSRENALKQERQQAVATYYANFDSRIRYVLRTRRLWAVVKSIDRKLFRVRVRIARLEAITPGSYHAAGGGC